RDSNRTRKVSKRAARDPNRARKALKRAARHPNRARAPSTRSSQHQFSRHVTGCKQHYEPRPVLLYRHSAIKRAFVLTYLSIQYCTYLKRKSTSGVGIVANAI